jgi:hypothetical protein
LLALIPVGIKLQKENLPKMRKIGRIFKAPTTSFRKFLIGNMLLSTNQRPPAARGPCPFEGPSHYPRLSLGPPTSSEYRTKQVPKELVIWSIIGGLSGYFVLHPIIHVISVLHFPTEQFPPTDLGQKIIEAFSTAMLVWSLSFMILSALIGLFWGKINFTVKEKTEAIEGLNKALEEVKTLSGFLPICASCKKIRDDKGYWNQIEAYISEHSEAQFSHGICPECTKTLYPDFQIE